MPCTVYSRTWGKALPKGHLCTPVSAAPAQGETHPHISRWSGNFLFSTLTYFNAGKLGQKGARAGKLLPCHPALPVVSIPEQLHELLLTVR